MVLQIRAKWHQPVALQSDAKTLYRCDDLEDVPQIPGVYMFVRKFDDLFAPLYIGKTQRLRTRLEQHLNSIRLLSALKGATNGSRYFLYCTAETKRGQQLAKLLKVLEDGLIAHSLGEGHQLLQKQGTRRPAHTVTFARTRAAESVVPRTMHIRAGAS